MSSFINFNNRGPVLENKYSAEVIKTALLKSETKSSVKAESLTKNIKEPVSLNEALVFFTDKLGAIKQLNQSIVDVNEGRVKQFEMDYASMVKDIKRGYGWIDPEYVADTWENSSDSIGFDLVRDEIFDRLIAAGLLAHADSNDPEKAGKYIKSAKDLYVMESEEDVEEISEERYYAFHKGQKHEIEADSLWGAKQKAITDLKVNKKDVGMLAIVLADSHDDFSKGKNADFAFEGETTVYESATAQLADEEKFELYTATLKNKTATITATTTTKTWDDGVPVLKYLARGKGKPTQVNINGSFEVAHDVARGWFYFTDGRKWFGLHTEDGYGDTADLPFNMEVKESVVNESEAENILQDLLDERGGDMGELHGMGMEDALDTVEAYGHKGSKAKKIAQELVSMCNESVVTEKTYNKKSLMKAMKADDGIIQLGNGEEYIIYAYDNGNDDNDAMWGDKTIFALDQDGEEHEIKYSDIVSYNESVVAEGYGEFIKAKNLTDIIKLSKQKKNATFYVTDDNNSRIGSFYLKNGKFAKATTANPNYDLQNNKTSLKDRNDVIYKYKVDESVVTEAVARDTKIYQIATPAPKSMLVGELEDLFGDDYRNYVTEFKDDEGLESVLVFNLTQKDIKMIQDNIGDVLIWEYSIKKGKEIMESADVNEKFFRMSKETIEKELYAASLALTNYYDWLSAGNDSGEGKSLDHIMNLLKKCKGAIKKFDKKEEVEGTAYESEVNEGRSVNKIQKEWNQVTTDMIQKVAAWKDAEGDRKAEILEELKALTAKKKALESELDVAVAGKDKDVQLVVSEGNAFGAARAEAIAKGEKTFKVDGEEYDVESVDKEDKENAEEFVSERNAFLAARAKAIQEESDEFEFNGKTYPVIYEGNAFGAARAEAIANGASTFTVDGEEYDVEDVDAEDKKNAEEFVEESEILWDALIEKFAVTNEDLRNDIKKYIKTNKKEIDALADQDNWDRIYSMLMTDFEVEEDDDKAADELKTIFNIVY